MTDLLSRLSIPSEISLYVSVNSKKLTILTCAILAFALNSNITRWVIPGCWNLGPLSEEAKRSSQNISMTNEKMISPKSEVLKPCTPIVACRTKSVRRFSESEAGKGVRWEGATRRIGNVLEWRSLEKGRTTVACSPCFTLHC